MYIPLDSKCLDVTIPYPLNKENMGEYVKSRIHQFKHNTHRKVNPLLQVAVNIVHPENVFRYKIE